MGLDDRLVDPQTLSRFLGVRLSWVYRQTCEKKIPVVKVGKYNRYRVADVLEALGGEARAADENAGQKNDEGEGTEK